MSVRHKFKYNRYEQKGHARQDYSLELELCIGYIIDKWVCLAIGVA